MKESLMSKIIKKAAIMISLKNKMNDSTENFFKVMRRISRPVFKNNPPIKIGYTTEDIKSREIYKIQYKKNKNPDKVIIYSNGGAWVNGMTLAHWRLLYNIAKNSNCVIYQSKYPLFPEHDGDELRSKLIENYKMILKLVKPDQRLVLMGDSAGGYNSLILHNMARKLKLRLPDQLVLLSPCIKSDGKGPADKSLDKKDLILAGGCADLIFNKMKGTLNNLETDIFNPFLGEYNGLRIDIIVGNHDMLYEHAVDFFKEFNAKFNIHVHEYDKMLHVFMLFPMREAKIAVKDIVNIISKDLNEPSSFQKAMVLE